MKKQGSCRQKRLNPQGEDDGPAQGNWLDSYADMISLLFALFIVLYGMSKVNEESFRQLAESLSKSLSTGGAASVQIQKEDSKTNVEQGGKSDKNVAVKKGDEELQKSSFAVKLAEEELPEDLKLVEEKLQKALQKHGMSSMTRLRMEERGLVVGLITDKLLFSIGDAELTGKCKEILNVVSPILAEINHPLRIEGHTCIIPIKNSRFRSNWELSTMRATNVAEYLITIRKIRPHRISIIGYGEYQPLFENNTESNRAKNRRVDIVILNVHQRFIDETASDPSGVKQVRPVKAPAEMQDGFWDFFSAR